MKTHYKFVMYFVFINLASNVLADSHRESQTTDDWRLEIRESAASSDHELNKVYQMAITQIDGMDHLPKNVKDELKKLQIEAQRAWIKFRDADSKVHPYLYYGGSYQSAASTDWEEHLTRQRTQDLKDRYQIE